MKNLPRYTLEQSISCGKPLASFKLDPQGQWVNFSDIKDILKLSDNSQSTQLNNHACAFNRGFNGTCFICGKKHEEQ